MPPEAARRKVIDVVTDNGASSAIAGLFAELAGALLTDVGPTEVLALLTARSPAMLRVDSAGGVVVDGSQLVITGSHETAKSLMLYEMQCGHGPSWDCFHSGLATVNVNLTEATDRWPAYAPKAVSAGITTSTALPLRARSELVGALYFCGRTELAEVDVGRALADAAAAIVATQHALARSVRTASQLQSALSSRVVIEQAKGIIAEHRRVPVDEAFKLLRAHARDSRRSIHEVASDVAAGGSIPQLLPRRRDLPSRRHRPQQN